MKLLVCHPLPAIRQALIDGLAAGGIEAEERPDDLLEWLRANQPASAVLSPDHPAWNNISRVLPATPLVALIETDDPKTFARALAAGAAGVVSSTWDVNQIVRTIQDALRGSASLPLNVARALAIDARGPPTDPSLLPGDVKILRLLCAGATTEQIASALGYSQRQTQRILRKLYGRMGVDGRTQAIIQATHWECRDA